MEHYIGDEQSVVKDY